MSYKKVEERTYRATIQFTDVNQFQTILPAKAGKYFLLTGIYWINTNNIDVNTDCIIVPTYGSADTQYSGQNVFLTNGMKANSANRGGFWSPYFGGDAYGALIDLTYPLRLKTIGTYTAGKTTNLNIFVKGIMF
jgi:hypothetical protein